MVNFIRGFGADHFRFTFASSVFHIIQGFESIQGHRGRLHTFFSNLVLFLEKLDKLLVTFYHLLKFKVSFEI